jgi:hypothetical protein
VVEIIIIAVLSDGGVNTLSGFLPEPRILALGFVVVADIKIPVAAITLPADFVFL